MLKLLIDELKISGFSKQTVKTYLFFNEKFLNFVDKKPENIEETDIKSFLAHIISDKNYKPSSINLALSSLRFYYGKILEKDIFKKIDSPKQEKQLPTVLSKDEIKSMINITKNRKHRLLIELLYSSGLRVSEAVNMKINHLDLKENFALVKSGKGKKDRLVILSKKLAKHLFSYLKKRNDNNPYLFPSRKNNLSIRQAQKIVKKSAEKARINKRVFCHASQGVPDFFPGQGRSGHCVSHANGTGSRGVPCPGRNLGRHNSTEHGGAGGGR